MLHMAGALQIHGHTPIIVTSRIDGLQETEETLCGLIYRIYDKSEARTAKVRDQVLAIAKAHDVDLIEGADHHGELSRIIRARRRPPVLVKIHGSNPVRILQDSQIIFEWQRWFVKMAHMRHLGKTHAERFSIEHADMAFVPSHRMKSELARQGLRLPVRNAVLPNPVLPFDGIHFNEAGKPTILMVARIDAGKGIQYLPAILKGLSDEFPDIALEIAGEDSFARGLGSIKEWLIGKLGSLSTHVRFLGKLNPQQLNEAYGRAWVIVIPSRWDNFPNVLLEAMTRGKPVIASPNGGMPEMLEGTLCGTAPPDTRDFVNLVAGLLRDASLRQRAGESLKAKAREAYAPEVVVRNYIDTLKRWGVSG